MQKILISCFFFLLTGHLAQAQIIHGQDTLYGNEWVNFGQSYFKIMVAEDGIYRVPQQVLADANVPLGQVAGSQFQLFHNGEEVPIYVTTDGVLGGSDFIEFFGKKNTSELDRHLFKNPDEEMMNPLYSLFTDTSAYFLTWKLSGGNLRYETMANDLTNLPAKEEYFMAEQVLNYFSAFSKKSNAQNIASSDYGITEGYSNAFANVQNIAVTPSNVYTGGPNGQLSIRYGTNIGQHQQLITLNDQPLVTEEFYDFQVRQLEFEVPNGTLSAPLALKFQGLATNTDRQRISNVILRFPAGFNFNGQSSFSFELPSATAVRYLEIENFNAAGGTPVLYDLTHRTRMLASIENGLVKIALPPSTEPVRLLLVNDAAGVKTVGQPIPVSFIDFAALDAEFIILSNPKLYDDGNGNDWVQQYADFRSTTAGGGYQTVIVDVQQLYEQFGWGLNRHSLSIRNFAHFVKKKWSNPQYFFIVGKGREYTSVRTQAQLSNANNQGYYVPTFGVPGSDNLLLAGSDGFTPVIPVGRIAASTAEDIRVYLEKVQQFEANRDLPQTVEDKAWMKRILHLGGGQTNSEQAIIRSYLSNMESDIEAGKFGGEVKSFFKTSTDPIQIPQTQQLFDIINAGVSMVSFFGHSSVGSFDFSIDNPVNYSNEGKYPLMFSLGCYSGNIHTSTVGVSERFIFFEKKGAVAFGATSGLGYMSSLYDFASEFYRLIGSEMYGQGIGDALQAAIRNKPSGGFGLDLIRQQFNYHGDPALRLNPAPGPDYVIDAASARFSPEQVTASLDTFELKFNAANIGHRLPDSVVVQVTQRFPNGLEQTVVQQLIPSPGFSQEMVCKIPGKGALSVGLNRFFIKVDATDRVAELPMPAAEGNNDLQSGSGEPGISLFIADNSAQPVWPPEFAVVSDPALVLKASTTNPLLPAKKYLLQLDTTETFNSPAFLQTEIVQPGGVVKWKPPVAWQDGQVYYWRVSPDSVSAQEGFLWSGSSFLFKNDSPAGWNQSHFYQFKKDNFVNLELPSHGNLDFITNFKDFNIRNAVNTVEAVDIRVNNAWYGRYWGLPTAGVYVLWMDSVFVEPKVNFPPGQGPYQYGIPHPSGWWVRTFMFDTSVPTGRKDLMDFLDDAISEHEYVALFTVQGNASSDYKPNEWAADSLVHGKNIFQILESQGAQLVRNLETSGSKPYIIAYQKGNGVIDEQIASSLTSVLNLYFSLPGNWDRGFIQSPLIGPAKKWGSLDWQAHSVSQPQTDTISLAVYGVAANGLTETLLLENLPPGELDLSATDVAAFPFLKLKFNSKDSIFRSSALLDYWRVLYDGVPEFAVNPAAAYVLKSDTVQQGEPFSLEFAVENLSTWNGDSLLVKYTWRDRDNNEASLLRRLPPLAAEDTLIAHFPLTTKELASSYQLSAEVNPADDQPEQIHLNNFLHTGFFVEADRRNPLLNVTFDGAYILDGDLVSAKPHIALTLQDENRFLTLDDTALFKLFLLLPDSAEQPLLVSFSDPAVQFTPASGNGENKARVEFSPVFTKDGTYALIVQSRDATGNSAGRFDFKVTFKVITKSMISNVLNYPNPFSTATRFVYTLTGSEPPARFKIQILTISGRIVREITQDEIGDLKVGTHQTDFVWDGTDEFGDRLANGVYLYRVLAQNAEGKAWETFETGADQFFDKGYGKMVIVR